ncbi:uncharacterized protein EV420DRAFT_1134564 [Desarmillaria tabescens]|uniref:HNH nuclease domain-containing protein n=1 Tax=Armillaria tabescens TaxID=1929756 RepID=A0AA39MMN7_ARMTA|nr:uncharacterized protein EV420DRAFT_1134564 [Desarmillaria tabescens]KAK0440431.1 hypothetical protein EV420DRAFT_1134564 [Desarmillaria tabescens]
MVLCLGCGGDRGLRYVSSAIYTCKRNLDTSTTHCISQLALAWFAYFLWPFKAFNWYSILVVQETDKDELPSPLYELRQQLLRQQNYRCPITGVVEMGHPKLPGDMTSTLGIFHILERPIIGFEKFDFFEPITREIIENYFPTLDLDSLPEDPSNAIALERNTYTNFTDLRMSLKATANANEYRVETYGECLWAAPLPEVIVIKEADPQYLRSHSCVADVLHQSGAGRVIDKILGCLPQRTSAVHPADIIDLQGVLDILGLRYSLVTALQLPQLDDGVFV